jgi:hypothetical protein
VGSVVGWRATLPIPVPSGWVPELTAGRSVPRPASNLLLFVVVISSWVPRPFGSP